MKRQSQAQKEHIKKLVEDNMWVVESVVRRISASLPPYVDRDDLIGSGLLGLVQAATRYDPERGVKFELWAEVRVRGAILDHLRSLDFMARPARTEAKRISSTITSLENELGREPEDEEVAKALGVSVTEYRESLEKISYVSTVSLDEVISDISSRDGRRRLSDIIPDPTVGDPIDAADMKSLREMVTVAVEKLPEKEKMVLKFYYTDGLSMKEIADVMGVTESRVSQIHSKAILRLRSMLDGKF
jgi:RNA polymerase sigma factor for flagellar operon FliA